MRYEYERPWPEALAGALIGAMLTLILAFHPATARLVDDGRMAIVTMAVGALSGAALSWWLARPLMGRVTQLEREIVEEQSRAA